MKLPRIAMSLSPDSGSEAAARPWSIHDTVELEKRGVPTIAVVGKGFEKAARSFGRAYKLSELRLLLVDDTVAHQGGDELLQLAVGGVDQVVEEWGKGAGDTNGAAAQEEWRETLIVEGGFLEANQLLLEMELTDGLPVIPPTLDLVEQFVAASGRNGRRSDRAAHASYGQHHC